MSPITDRPFRPPPVYRLFVHTVNLPDGTTTIATGTGLEVATGTLDDLTGFSGSTFEVGGGAGTVRLTGTATVPTITVDSGSTLGAATVNGNITTTGTVETLSPREQFHGGGDFQPAPGSVGRPGKAGWW